MPEKTAPSPPSGVSSSATPANTDIDDRPPGILQLHGVPKPSLIHRTLGFLGRGIRLDIKARAPYYLSDWTDAWNYRVVPATCLIFFAKCVPFYHSSMNYLLSAMSSVLPGIAFSLDLIETTGMYGVAEVLISSFMAAGIFSIFGAQPLCIAGVTGTCLFFRVHDWIMTHHAGPITVLNKTIYDITQRGDNPPDYLQFIGWVYLWGAILHWVTAILNCKNSSVKVNNQLRLTVP
jgi:boron transporter